MAQKITVVLLSNADLSTSNDRTSQSGSEEVSILVNGVALNRSEDNLLNKLLLKVLDNHTLSTESKGLLLDGIKVFDLANIGEEALQSVKG